MTVVNPAGSAIYDFCKVKKIYDENVYTPPEIVYEDCVGIGYLAHGKDLAKAYCWKGANDLHEGKCETSKSGSNNTQEDPPL